MDDEVYEKYRRAGKIAADARDYGKSLIGEGKRLLGVANKIESKIRENDVGIAFPVNMSINEVAAHYTPRHDDTVVFRKGDVVKLDIGVHVDGYIADTASTLEIGTNKYADMIKASRDALENVIGVMKDNVKLSDIGETIERSILSYGYKSIDNLTGHSLENYVLHSGISVPNVADTLSNATIHAGDVLAVEPFATDGAGHVIHGEGSNIYICNKPMRLKIVRDTRSRVWFQKISGRFRTLPFAERWCVDTMPNVDVALKKLAFLGLIKHYPQLIEKNRGMVTQAEHTVIITENGCEVTT